MLYYQPGHDAKTPFHLPLGFRREVGRKQSILNVIATLIIISIAMTSCGKKPSEISPDDRKAIESIVATTHGADSLALLQQQMENDDNLLGSVIAYRELGKILRNESRFEEALRAHSEGLRQAETLNDTLEIVQALNNIGTDYRRMGVLDMAQDYHYRAWMTSKECSDTSFTAKKNRVVSLNGLGNIYMTLGNYERADSVLRAALKGEKELNSALGQAINYANIGSIFQHRNMLDSAWVYYRKSMALNHEAGSTLGISLCHTYFGSLYEKAQRYDRATTEYEEAYQLMKASKDEWHALNSLIALSGIHSTTGNEAQAMEYLDKAKQMALSIKSKEHLAEIYTLYYKHYKRIGDYQTALTTYEKAVAMEDSLLDMEKVNRIQNTSLNIERNRQEREMDKARLNLEKERAARDVDYIVFGLIVLALIGTLAAFIFLQRIHRRNHLALKRLTKLRENFFTNITHEFRTPLTVILGISHDLQAYDDQAVKDSARTIERQGKGLLALINQLLDISKIKSAVGNIDWRNGNICAHLEMIIETYRGYSRSKNIDLQYIAKETVVMDFVPDYVNKVFNNLISNALKFTPEYGKVSVALWRKDDNLHIDVADTGEGMSKETAKHVFEPFYQGESEMKNNGSGVGLALVKQIIDAVEGTITVNSKEGNGTTFHIIVPIHNNCKQQLESAAANDNTPMLPTEETILTDSDGNGDGDDDQCTLLIIEDNRDIAAYIGSQFSDRYAIAYATNGKDGLAKAIDLVPDLVITDLMMPGMDGLEVCRQIRANEVVNHIPIIVVTAKITEEERIKGIEAGADAYLAKPFNAEELRTRVETLLNRLHNLRNKYGEGTPNNNTQEAPLTDAERRFLAKTVDAIYLLLDQQTLGVNSLAEKLCMSPRQFHRKIVALTADSPATYIMKIKMKRARHLLETKPNMNIEDIAMRCGFEHTTNFYHAFRKVYGITPTELRRGASI